jgi:hypothetical protein
VACVDRAWSASFDRAFLMVSDSFETPICSAEATACGLKKADDERTVTLGILDVTIVPVLSRRSSLP